MNAPSDAPCHVFTPAWTAAWVNRHKRHPEYALPHLHHFWTAPEFQDHRDVIERRVDALSPANRLLVIPRLRDVKLFEQTHAELAVGTSLRQAGHSVEYEVPLWRDKKPDWYVRPACGNQPFLVEVVSSKASKERSRLDAACERLLHRIEQLPGTAFVVVQANFHSEQQLPPSDGEIADIVNRVDRLLKRNPPVGHRENLDEFGVELIDHLPDSSTVSCFMSYTARKVDPEPLTCSVSEKASKYRELVEAVQLPFVVCVVPDRRTGRNLDDLRDAVFGTRGSRPIPKPGAMFSVEYYRESDGLFAKYPTLSGAMIGTWIGKELGYSVVFNPDARYPLPEQAFARPPFEMTGSEAHS
jgi:hypothetical protein